MWSTSLPIYNITSRINESAYLASLVGKPGKDGLGSLVLTLVPAHQDIQRIARSSETRDSGSGQDGTMSN